MSLFLTNERVLLRARAALFPVRCGAAAAAVFFSWSGCRLVEGVAPCEVCSNEIRGQSGRLQNETTSRGLEADGYNIQYTDM